MKLRGLLWFACALVALIGCGHSGSHAAPDALATNDAPLAHPFACENSTCDSDTQYCFEFVGGAGGVAPTIGCNALPAACASSHTCDCVMANTTTGCGTPLQCSVQGAAVTVICQGI